MDDLRYGTVSGFAAAAAEAHRRRTSSARAAALAVAVVVAMGGTSGLVGRSSSFDRVEPAVPTVEPSPPAAARPSQGPAGSAGMRSGGGAGEVTGGAEASPRPVVAPSPAVGAPPATREDGARPAGPQSGPVTRFKSQPMTLSCVPAAGSCFDVEAPRSEGDLLVLSASYCAADRRSLTFAENVEVSFEVAGWHRVLWTSLGDHPAAPARHEVGVGTTECVRWTTRWRKATNDGTPLPKARYALKAVLRTDTPYRDSRTTFFDIR